MKKILIVTCLILAGANSFAQTSYVKLQIGYGMPMANTLINESVQSNPSNTIYTGAYGSFGSGLRVEAGYICSLNTRFDFELDVTRLFGKSIKSSYNSSSSSQAEADYSRFWEISPLFRVNLGGTKIKPYASLGPAIGFGNYYHSNSFNSNGANPGESLRKYQGSAAVGAKVAFGTEFTQGRFTYFAQATLVTMNYAPTKSELTKYVVNGVDQLGNLSVNQKQSVYSNTVTTTNTNNPNQPYQGIKFYAPFNSISLNFGIKFKI